MSKLLKVTLEFEDKVLTLEGSEAEKWASHNEHVASFAEVHNFNPFTNDPINWQEVSVEDLLKHVVIDEKESVSLKSSENGTNDTTDQTNLNQYDTTVVHDKDFLPGDIKPSDEVSTNKHSTSSEQSKKKGTKGKQP